MPGAHSGMSRPALAGEVTQSYRGMWRPPSQHPRRLSSAVPSLSGIRDWFCGRQLFHGRGREQDASGSNVVMESNGERQMKLCLLTHHSPPAEWLVPNRSRTSTRRWRPCHSSLLAGPSSHDTSSLCPHPRILSLVGWQFPKALLQNPFTAAACSSCRQLRGTPAKVAKLPTPPSERNRRKTGSALVKNHPASGPHPEM